MAERSWGQQLNACVVNSTHHPHPRPQNVQREVEAAQKAKFDAQVARQDAGAALEKLQQVADKLRDTEVCVGGKGWLLMGGCCATPLLFWVASVRGEKTVQAETSSSNL